MADFELNLENNLVLLHEELLNKTWKPKPYKMFSISDPKLRLIHKAEVRDRVVFQAVYRSLYPIFDPGFIFASYSSRVGRGTHKGVFRFEVFARKLTNNYKKSGFVLKCDIRKFFDSIDHEVLLRLVAKKIKDVGLFNVIKIIVNSFETNKDKGLPLGNVTSQIFANIYLNELDQFVKHDLKIKYYIRYCDDFVILDNSYKKLFELIPMLSNFLQNKLFLNLHPRKVEIRKIIQGVDFLGYVSLPFYRVLRTSTKNRMLKRITEKNAVSYFGLLKHCKGYKLSKKIENFLRGAIISVK